MALKSAKNTQLRASLFVTRNNFFFNNELINDNKTLKAPMKPKTQLEMILKGKKRPKMLDIKKINQQMDQKKLINLFIKKLS